MIFIDIIREWIPIIISHNDLSYTFPFSLPF